MVIEKFSDKNANKFIAQGLTFFTNEMQTLILKWKILQFSERKSSK